MLLAKADPRGAIRQFDSTGLDGQSRTVVQRRLTLIQMNQFEAHNAQKLFEVVGRGPDVHGRTMACPTGRLALRSIMPGR